MGSPFSDYAPDDVPDSTWISEARQLAATARLLLEHPKIQADEGHSGLYETARRHAQLILHLVQESESCPSAEEFDVLLYLICNLAESLAFTLSQLPIP